MEQKHLLGLNRSLSGVPESWSSSCKAFQDGDLAHQPSKKKSHGAISHHLIGASSTLQRRHASPHDLIHQQDVAGNDRAVGKRKHFLSKHALTVL